MFLRLHRLVPLLALLLFTFQAPAAEPTEALAVELKTVAAGIVWESWRDDNWELMSSAADGSDPVNLTNTPKLHELSPHASADGSKLCFVADEGQGEDKMRNVYVMDADGGNRVLVARNARQPCWKADGSAIAYLPGEFDHFSIRDYATRGIVVYDLASGEKREHPNKELFHLYNLCWTPDGRWFLATVHAGMGFRHAILAIEADGLRVVDLKIPGCRPDVSADGRQIAWGASDWALRVGDLDCSGPTPRVTNVRDVVTSQKPTKIYHIDWSPDGRYVAFSRGPATQVLGQIPELVGVRAAGWDLGVADAARTNCWIPITSDGLCNKEPDWMPSKHKPEAQASEPLPSFDCLSSGDLVFVQQLLPELF